MKVNRFSRSPSRLFRVLLNEHSMKASGNQLSLPLSQDRAEGVSPDSSEVSLARYSTREALFLTNRLLRLYERSGKSVGPLVNCFSFVQLNGRELLQIDLSRLIQVSVHAGVLQRNSLIPSRRFRVLFGLICWVVISVITTLSSDPVMVLELPQKVYEVTKSFCSPRGPPGWKPSSHFPNSEYLLF